ncbi:hypothetical protein [Cerasicoccus frondis]|uniref:hypothetical protein n=1 Tax=Cerasicoccus frondis TaxID=490090 RepID=UPI0028524CE8|nr:hypothetical protein [Cerasicoccus frondis]
MKTAVMRNLALFITGLLGLMLTGCYSAREFEYKGAELDTIQDISIDNREPYPVPRDSWRLGPKREAVVNGEEIQLAASEDGSTILFKIKFYPFGKKSALIKQSTERSTKALDGILADLKEAGYPVTKKIAIIDHANVIGYKFGGPARIKGFYLFSKPGAYDALLPMLDTVTPETEEAVEVEAETLPETPMPEAEHEIEE